MFLLPESPMIWIFVIAVIFLLFGGSKLPQLAKALGQSKKAFREGIAEADEDEALGKPAKPATLASVDDEELFEEARRRARLRVSEGKND
jgi:TatA/E family protein of Tat protein translocase